MNEIQRGILTLLKSAVTGEPGALPEAFSLEAAMPTIRKHQLYTLAYQGAALCGIPDSEPQMMLLFKAYCRNMLHSESQMEMVGRLFAAFEENGIDYMPLKGCKMKALYPKQELRVMGDADVLIRKAQYGKIRPIVAGLGMVEEKESDHDYGWNSAALHLELHKQLIPAHSQDFHAYFGDGWHLAYKETDHRYAMRPEDEFLYQFAHYTSHYRIGGIGCRHVLDLWVYLRAHPDLDMAYIHSALQKLHLQEFYENTRRMLEYWFGSGAGDEKTEFMTAYVFDSGSWGTRENHTLSAAVREAQTAGSVRGGRVRAVFLMFFPPHIQLINLYPVLKRAPWLLPFIWPVRWVDVLLFRRKSIHRRQRSFRTATADKVEKHQSVLHYMGLDFRHGK